MMAGILPRMARSDDGTGMTRRVTVTPHMCGGSASIFAQLGDWTWETVAVACGTNVYNAHTDDGMPAYLSFFYFHVSGGGELHPHGLTFGDDLDVVSQVFGFGSESVLTLHRLSRAGAPGVPEKLTPEEFFDAPRSDCLYVQNFNRWISRSAHGGNSDLVRSAPPGFRHEHLPELPRRHSPRDICSRARKQASFHPDGVPGYSQVAPSVTVTYDLDVVHDFNGVGLVYFASYFSIADTALLRVWKGLGRTDRSFLSRRVLDHKLGYFGNADPDSTLSLRVRLWRCDTKPSDEIAEVVVRDLGSGRLLAVCAIRLLLVAS